MKALKIIIGILVGFVVIAAAYFAYALYINPKSPMGSAAYSNGDKEISVRYYRPYKKDRLMPNFSQVSQSDHCCCSAATASFAKVVAPIPRVG